MVVIRSFQLTQKKTALQFKALDQVLPPHTRTCVVSTQATQQSSPSTPQSDHTVYHTARLVSFLAGAVKSLPGSYPPPRILAPLEGCFLVAGADHIQQGDGGEGGYQLPLC